MPLDGPSGASAHLRGIGRGLLAAGYDVTPAVLRRTDHRGSVDDVWDGPIVQVEPTPKARLGKLRELAEAYDGRRLRRAAQIGEPYDVVWERFALGGWGGRRLGERHLLEVNAPIGRERSAEVRSASVVRALERGTLRRAGRVVAVSPWLVDWCALSGVRARYLRQGSALPIGDRDRGRRILADHGVPSTPLLVGWQGAPRQWHHLERLPDLAEHLPDARLVVVGSDASQSHARVHPVPRLAAQPLADVVAALDVALGLLRSDAPPWLAPLKIADALHQGVPVVTAAAAGAVALLAGHGRVVSSDDPTAWGAAIRSAASDPRTVAPRSWTDVVREALDTP